MIGVPPLSVQLASSTRENWKENGVIFFRDRAPVDTVVRMRDSGIMVCLNLGNSTYTKEVWREAAPFRNTLPRLWNDGETISSLNTPGKLRRSVLGQFIPPQEPDDDEMIWLKGPGYGGENKTPMPISQLPVFMPGPNWDWQRAVVGNEYRVHTVNNIVVQVHARYGINGAREYEWLGVGNAPPGLIPFTKTLANTLLDQSPKLVIGWDIIQSTTGEWFLFEPNFNPGVNSATAARIVNKIKEIEEL